ncbi:MAG: FAD-dependent oxidoreductase, partial [Thermoguttaceae bacterium]|nr:FAD-dependent oxidoreductase [Thermoguttaceae bacterium]
MTNYDILVVGGGPGGYIAAVTAAKYGFSVALIEKEP